MSPLEARSEIIAPVPTLTAAAALLITSLMLFFTPLFLILVK
jgi:hypothetical protein